MAATEAQAVRVPPRHRNPHRTGAKKAIQTRADAQIVATKSLFRHREAQQDSTSRNSRFPRSLAPPKIRQSKTSKTRRTARDSVQLTASRHEMPPSRDIADDTSPVQ